MFRQHRTFLWWPVVSTSPNPQAGGPLFICCPRLRIQYIRSYRPIWRPFLHRQPEDAPCCGDRDPLTMSLISLFQITTSFAPCFSLVWVPVIIVIVISVIRFANLCNHVCKGEGHPVTWHWRHRGGSRGTALPMLNLAARWGWVVNATPRLLYPREGDPVPNSNRRLGGPRVRSGRALKISTPPGSNTEGKKSIELKMGVSINCVSCAIVSQSLLISITEEERSVLFKNSVSWYGVRGRWINGVLV
jgi:hypothetical protein